MVSEATVERLYDLLPAIYRIRDRDQGDPLRALLAILETELDRLEQDVDGLYDDWFIETCAEWVAPYIGDLLEVRSLHAVSREQEGESVALLPRAYVANTLSYRRRKGTAPVLEQLARDVTGWPARAVEFFERLITTQHLNHVRLHSLSTVDLRHANELELLHGPFERAAHTAEVRRITSNRGKYNIPNIGLFLWRLQSYFVTRSTPRPASDSDNRRYLFSPLSNDAPLFNRPQTETEITHLAQEINVPGALRRRALYDDLEAYRHALVSDASIATNLYFNDRPAWQIFFDGAEDSLLPEEMIVCNLSGWDAADWEPPASQDFTRADPEMTTFATQVAVDPVLGRLVILNDVTPPEQMQVSYAYGFSSDIGGGPYDRRATLATAASLETWTATVDQQDAVADYTNLTDALTDWLSSDRSEAIITITDSGTYTESISIQMGEHRDLVVQAGNRQRPTIQPVDDAASLADLLITGGDGDGASLTLNGLLIEGGIRIDPDSVNRLQLVHCTLVPGCGLTIDGQPRRPGRTSVRVASPNADLQMEIRYSIVGPLRLPETITSLTVQDSIIDSPLRGGPARCSPVLVSGSLSPFPTLISLTPTVAVQIGGEGPHNATLADVPMTLAQARDQLQAAIREADSSPAFSEARVITAANRLIVLPGTPDAITITAAEADDTAAELRLTEETDARSVQALLSGALTPSLELRASIPMLSVTMGAEGPYPITLDPVTETLVQARNQLHSAIREVETTSSAFQDAIVASLDDRLVVVPGVSDVSPLFGATSDDRTTLIDLGLQADYPAIAASADGAQPGPPTCLERTTVFGRVFVRQLDLVSETICTSPIEAQRRQIGCMRFSYIPAGSRVPRRFRCQPDLALEGVTDPAEQTSIQTRLIPVFTSERYGQPGYAQLRQVCAEEIRTGAEDGSEMGVFSHLKQPQREANLRASLEEYLRFGLAAGIFYIT